MDILGRSRSGNSAASGTATLQALHFIACPPPPKATHCLFPSSVTQAVIQQKQREVESSKCVSTAWQSRSRPAASPSADSRHIFCTLHTQFLAVCFLGL